MNEGRIALLRLSAALINDESDRVRLMYDRAAESYERFGGEFAHYWERCRSRLQGVVRDGDTLLDVGCGPGHLIADLPPSVAVFGCDVSPAMVELAARARSTGTFAVHDFHEPFPASWPRADVTTALGCLEFCTDLGRVIQNLATATKPGGLLLLTVPCIESSAQREILLRPLDITLRSWEDAEAEAAFGAAGLEVISHDRGPGYTAPDIGSVEYGFWELKNSRL
jgi:SAM-dependent methyltransferase